MVKAYVLIECDTGSVQSAVGQMQEMDEVKESTAVTGEYDIIAELEVEQVDELLKTVAGKIHEIGGIGDTTTCIAT